jgi:proteic killer suppression protein
MEIDYANSRIKRDCCTFAAMKKNFGERRAEILNTRLKQLEEVSCLEEIRDAPGQWHELTQNRKGQIAASVGQGHRLIVAPSEDPPPTKPDGGLDWPNITAVTIIEIVDYH